MLLMLTEVVVVMPIVTMVTVGWRTASAVPIGG